MRMTREDWQTHNSATTCHMCEKPLEGDSVCDHCHITGEYRGAVHNACNLKLHLSPKTTTIPVVFHNLRGYDSHLLMQTISKVEGRISCIPNNTEKYVSFSLGQLRFFDSAHFLLASLDKLVAANKPEAFKIMGRYEPSNERRELLLHKGVYPYEYMDSWEHFAEPKLPPPKEAFFSKLSDQHISEDDYAHAQRVWETFGCCNLGDYHDLYNRTDVLLLGDVFETFRKTCMQQYGLNPAHYYISPGLRWDTLLKKTGAELELLTDFGQHLFIEKGMRGVSPWSQSVMPGLIMPEWRAMTHRSPTATSYTWMPTTFMVGQWASRSQWATFDGWKTVTDLQRASEIAQQTALSPGSGSGIPGRATRGAQCISAGTGAHGGSNKVDIKVPARPSWRWGGAYRGWEVGP